MSLKYLYISFIPLMSCSPTKINYRSKLQSSTLSPELLRPSLRFNRSNDQKSAELNFELSNPGQSELIFRSNPKEQETTAQKKTTSPKSFSFVLAPLKEQAKVWVKIKVFSLDTLSIPYKVYEFDEDELRALSQQNTSDQEIDTLSLSRINIPLRVFENLRIKLRQPLKGSDLKTRRKPTPGCEISEKPTPNIVNSILKPYNFLSAEGYLRLNAKTFNLEKYESQIGFFEGLNPSSALVLRFKDGEPEQELNIDPPSFFDSLSIGQDPDLQRVKTKDLSTDPTKLSFNAAKNLDFSWLSSNSSEDQWITVRIYKAELKPVIVCNFLTNSGKASIEAKFLREFKEPLNFSVSLYSLRWAYRPNGSSFLLETEDFRLANLTPTP